MGSTLSTWLEKLHKALQLVCHLARNEDGKAKEDLARKIRVLQLGGVTGPRLLSIQKPSAKSQCSLREEDIAVDSI